MHWRRKDGDSLSPSRRREGINHMNRAIPALAEYTHPALCSHESTAHDWALPDRVSCPCTAPQRTSITKWETTTVKERQEETHLETSRRDRIQIAEQIHCSFRSRIRHSFSLTQTIHRRLWRLCVKEIMKVTPLIPFCNASNTLEERLSNTVSDEESSSSTES